MKPSLILGGVSFVVVLLHLSLFTPTASAQSKSCATPPDYKGPFSSAFSQNPELQDCSTDPICDPNSPAQAYNQVAQDWLDHAQIECIADAEQAYRVYGNKSFIQRLKDKDLTGKSTGSLNWITNTALSPELQQSGFEDLSPRSRAISNDKDRFDPAIFNGYCLYKGYNSIDECYQAIGELIPTSSGNPFPNLMALGNRLDKLLPTHELLKLERETCNDIILPCYAGNAPESVLCSHVYYLNDTANVSQVCADLNEISDADYLKLDPTAKMKYLAVTFVTTLRPAFMVIAPNVELTRLAPGVYTQDGKFTHSNIPTLVRPFFIPGVSGALNQGALQELKMTLTLDQGNTTLNEIKAFTLQTYGPTQNTCALIKDQPQADSTPYQCVINKINQFQPCQTCVSSPKEEAQFFVSAHPPVGAAATGIIGFFLNLVGRIDKPEEIDGTQLKHFSGWFVIPGDLAELDQAQDLHANAPSHIYQDLKTVQNTLVKQSMPIPINNQGDGSVEVTVPQPTAIPGTTPKPGEDTTVGASGQGSVKTASFFDGGNLITTLMKTFNVLLRLDDKERFQNQCYQPELLSKTQGSAIGAALSAVSGLVGGQEFDQYCPNNPKLAPFFTGGTTTPTDPITDGKVRQHLFETTCGGTACHDYILSRTLSGDGSCNGKVLNPYVAIAIALNENGGLVSCQPGAKEPNHFGCDIQGLAGFGQTIEEKTTCMLNTLVNKCRAGWTDQAILNNYGYSNLQSISPLAVLGYTGNDLFVSSSEANSGASYLRSDLPTKRDLWWKYYCPGWIVPYASKNCNQTVDCNAPAPK